MLSGRLALVTGGARGIGRAVCQVLANDGARVVVADLDRDGCEETLKSLKQEDHHAIKLDVSSGESVKDAMKQITEKYQTCPDAVVNSAGITMDGYLLKMTDDNFDKVIDVNLKGTYRINKIAASAMKSAKLEYGSIVNISSIVGKTGNAGQTNYAASKAGVIGFTKSAAKELGKFGIRVNAICPGFINTPMIETIPEHMQQMILYQIPLGTMGQPEDIAETASFLLSKKSKYITGTVIDVAGGLL